jgi:hypothetical protein
MDNPEKLAKFGTQDTRRRQTKLRAMKNGQSRETGDIGYTRHRTKTNKTEGQSRMDNPEKLATFGNIWYTRHWKKTNKTEVQSRMDNPEKLTTFGTQDGGRRQTQLRGNEDWTIQRNCQHLVHKTHDEDKQN